MEPTRKIKPLIQRMRDIYNSIQSINYRLQGNISPGMQDSLLKSRNMQESNLKSSFKKLDQLVNGGYILLVRYRITYPDPSIKEFQKYFVNLSISDVKDYFSLLNQISGQVEYKILEFQVISTKSRLL